MESLAERILFSDGGSFLVTGYRGVGKTSYINQVIKKLEEALPWAEGFLGKTELVDVYLNVARPVQPAELMHHIIRQLHDRLIEKGIYQLLDQSLQESLTLAYHRTSVNMARKLAESSERSFGFNEASIGADWMKAAIKMSMSSKRSQTQNYEISYLGYDDKAAEHDILGLCRRLVRGYNKQLTSWRRLKSIGRARSTRVRLKIVFVFDELDKLEEFTETISNNQKPVIDQILGALKNLFTTSGVTFVFVAGKDLQERWLEDVGKGDSVYESVFSYDRYLPCLWADVDSICDTLVDQRLTHSRQIYTDFKQYLAYKGRGIPRRIIRTFNEYVEWSGDQPVLAFTPQSLRRIRFFADLQSVLRSHETQLFGETHEEILGTQSDKRRLGVYYLIDWILRQGSSEFTRKNVLTASKLLSAKIALAEESAPHVAEDIFQILIDADYIQELRNTLNRVLMGDPDMAPVSAEKRYKLTPRRLVEFGGFASDGDVDPAFALPVDTLVPDRTNVITKIGKYRITRTIGQGGMGIVYEALDDYSGRRVAIKMLFDQVNSELTARFEREAMIMGELNHPNIVRLYDWDRENERVYIVMEFLDGPTLEDIIRVHGKLSLELAVAIITPIIEAIDYVHKKGFVRNDIKPNNIKLTSTGRVCIIDFGITRPTSANPELLSKFNTMAGGLFGTPIFMAPEQFEDKTADERSDIYSLGVVLYNMLTGKYPLDYTGSLQALMQAHLERVPMAPSEHVALPRAIDEFILRCLERNPEKRFQTTTELLDHLSDATPNLPSVDLRSVANQIDREVREIEAMDAMRTIAPASSFVLPMSMSTGAQPEMASKQSLARAAPESELEFDTLTEPQTTVPLPGFPSLASPKKSVPLDLRPRINLLRGSMENSDFHLDAFDDGYRLEDKTGFGRSSENMIVLRDAKVSRYHGQFYLDGQNWFVEDFNSHRGTYVNGERIMTRRILESGTTIGIGDFIFAFERSGYL